MKGTDLSVKVGGLTFPNPIIPGAAEIVQDEHGVMKCIEQGVGGVVTKSFTSAVRGKPRPYHFNYRSFGKGLEEQWMGIGGWHPLSSEQAAETLIPKMSKLCRDAGIPFVVSMWNGPDVVEWVTDAKRFEQAGADMLELNFGSAYVAPRVGGPDPTSSLENIDFTADVIKAVKGAVKIPISGKRSITWVPQEHQFSIKRWQEAGVDFMTCHNGPFGMLIDVEEEVPFGTLGGGGGYSLGRPYLPWNLSRVIETRKLTEVPIIASGGVFQASDAIMYLLVGCPLVEVCSAIFKDGYHLFGEIIKGIKEWMERKGYSSIDDFRGKAYYLASQTRSAELIHMESPMPMPQVKSSPIIPAVDRDKCSLCGKCEDFCLSGVFSLDQEKETVEIDHENRCWGCGDCVGWCPKNAISLIDRKTREVVWDNRGLAKVFRPENWKK